MDKVNESIMFLYKAYLDNTSSNKYNYDKEALKKGILIKSSDKRIIKLAEDMWGIDGYILNQTFHKSLSTVVNSDIEKLVIDQIIHYITTYDFEALGLYNQDMVYIPKEKLEVPELNDNIKLIIISSITELELKNRLWDLITSSIPLSRKTIECIINLSGYLDVNNVNINKISNREVKIALYDKLNIIPKSNIEFLRYFIYKLTGSSLLIKDKATMTGLKNSSRLAALRLMNKYNELYGLIPLSEIFNRFKPLFLSLKTSNYKEVFSYKEKRWVKVDYRLKDEEKELNKIINRISKFSKKNHKSMTSNDLDNFMIWYEENRDKSNFKKVFKNKLKEETIWRIIKLRNYMALVNSKVSERVYKIRNGRSWITTKYQNVYIDDEILNILDDIIVNRLKNNVNGKSIYIDKYIDLVLPQSEKQFVSNIPISSKLVVDKDNLLVGIHWYNVNDSRVDLDLKVISNEYSIGWDTNYREGDKLIFTGDVTDAPYPNGASEYIYIDKSINNTIFSLKVNNYTRNVCDIEYDLIIAKSNKDKLVNNYIVDPNDIIVKIPKNVIENNKFEHSIGNIIINDNNIELVFTDITTSNRSVSYNSDIENILREYFYNENSIKCNLKNYLIKAGASIKDDNIDVDIDLSIDNLKKDSIIKLFK